MKSRKDKILNIKKIKKQVKGITLIALVVTIIVLLILAGIALNLTIGENGLFTRAQNAANTWQMAEQNEQNAMNSLADWIDDNMTPEVIDGVTIPKGFYYAGGSKDTGLVISDDSADKIDFDEATKTDAVSNSLNGNQFVWVPVENPDDLFETSETGVQLTGVDTTTNIYSKLSGGYDKPNTTGHREPDVLSYFDTDEQYYKTILGFANKKAMADSFVAEYKAMSDSIKKYNGFYIGRYELTGSVDSPKEKSGAVLTGKNWYYLYKACQNVVKGKENVNSTMIYGVQWDATMEWLKKTIFKDEPSKVDTDSSKWGNYNNYNSANSYSNVDEGYVSGAGLKQDTGYSEYWKANNIYDLAGNCFEWTQEANYTNCRVVLRWLLLRFRLWLSSV